MIDVSNFSFSGCIVKMAAGSTINVSPGKTLSITNTTSMFSCDQVNMWSGINAAAGSTVIVNSQSSISDAIFGIKAVGNAYLNIQNSTFNRNYTGISFQNSSSNTSAVSSTVFSCYLPGTATPANLLAPYTTQRSIYGISILNSVLVSANALTQLDFNNCITGINASISRFNVYDSRFNLCSTAVNTANQTGDVHIDRNTINNCTNGIFAIVGNKRFYASNNVIYHFTIGIKVPGIGASGGECYISGNYFNCKVTGPQGGFVLESYSYSLFGNVAIQVENKVPSQCIAVVAANYINNTRIGIYFRNVTGSGLPSSTYSVLANSNWIYMKVPYSEFNPPPGQSPNFQRLGFVGGGIKGILIEGSDWANTVQNEFSRDYDPGYSDNYALLEKMYLAGIYVNNSLNTDAHAGNIGYNVANAFYYQGNCSGTQMYCNQMYACNAGVSIGHSHNPNTGGGGTGGAYITQQFSTNNSLAGLNTWYGNLDPSRRVTGYNNTTGPLPIRWYFYGPYTNSNAFHPDAWTTVNPSVGFQTVTPASVTAATTCPPAALVPPDVKRTAQDREDMFRGIIDNSIKYDQLPEQYQYQSKRYYYQLMHDQPGWLNLGDARDAEYMNFYDQLQSSNIGKFAHVQELIDNGDVAGARDFLNSIDATNHIEENKIKCYTVYLNSFALENFEELTPEQREILIPVAYENSTSGGEGVFWARAMLDMLDGDNPDARFAKEESDVVNTSMVYPNPVNDRAYLPCKDGVVLITIFDVSGKKITAEKYVGSNNVVQINTSTLVNGFYTYKIQGEDIFRTGSFIK